MEETTSEPGTDQPADASDADVFVRSLADYANMSGLGVGITVQSHGMLVSGMTISNVQFFERAKEMWGASKPLGGDASVAESARTTLVDHAENMVKLMKERNASNLGDDATYRLPTYLHLQDVRFLVPGKPSIKANIWRCRIDQIAGFTLGQMTDE